jgi:hypothetical protein
MTELICHPRERIGSIILVRRRISLRAVHFFDAYDPIVGIDKVTFDVSILVNRSNQVVIEDQLRMAPIEVSNLYLSTENIISKQRKNREKNSGTLLSKWNIFSSEFPNAGLFRGNSS